MIHSPRLLAGALLLLAALISGCTRNGAQDSRETSRELDSDEALILPKGLSPTGVFTTTSRSLLVKAANGPDYRAVYSWEPGSAPKVVAGGRDLDIVRLTNDVFASWYSQDGKEFVVTLNAQKTNSEPLVLPSGTPTGWYDCQGDVQTLVCIGNRPGMKVTDKDFDEMAFTAVLVVDLEQQKTSWFPVEHQSYFCFDHSKKQIYLSALGAPSLDSLIGIFDLVGQPLGKTEFWNVKMSPSGRFADSVQEDGSESWAVYDAKSRAVLLAFNCNDPECRIGDREESHFRNPVFDDEVVALQIGGAYGKGGTCDIYQVSPAKLIKRLPCGGLPVYDWSRDGRQIITIEYEGGRFRRQMVKN